MVIINGVPTIGVRPKGTFAASYNFEANIAGPIDARLVVDRQIDLTRTDSEKLPYPYDGMIVAVIMDPDTAKNGVYWLRTAAGVGIIGGATGWVGPLGTGTGNSNVTVDQTIIDGSTNPVSGNAVFDALADKLVVKAFDTLPVTNSGNYIDSGAVAAGITAAINAIKGGVAVEGDTLNKLYQLIISQISEVTVANIAARDLYSVDNLPFQIFVQDDGDGKWALYKATSTGQPATFVKLTDADSLNATLSASQIRDAYESNADRNAFTDALKAKLDGIATGATANQSDAFLLNLANHTGTLNEARLAATTIAKLLPAGGTTGSILAKNSATDFDVEWLPVSDLGAGTLGDATNNQAVTATVSVGGVDAGDVFPPTLTWQECIIRLIVKIYYPDYENPFVSSFLMRDQSNNNLPSLVTINTTYGSITGTATLNKGSIKVQNNFQNFRSGDATGYTFSEKGITEPGQPLVVNNHNYGSYTTVQGNQNWGVSIAYAAGPQPLNSAGGTTAKNGTTLPLLGAGAVTSSYTIEGVWPIFATVHPSQTPVQLQLYSMLTANNIQINLCAEGGGFKAFFEFPKAWFTVPNSRPIQVVNFWNNSQERFEPDNKLTDYAQVEFNRTINGVIVPYIRFTNTSVDKGANLIRISF